MTRFVQRFGVTIGAALLLAASLLATVVDMVQLHPYQYVYFNRVVAGGLPRAAERYDTDYWGAAGKEAVEWTVDHYTRRNLQQPVGVTALSEHALLRQLEELDRGRRRFVAVRFARAHEAHVLFMSASPLHRQPRRGGQPGPEISLGLDCARSRVIHEMQNHLVAGVHRRQGPPV